MTALQELLRLLHLRRRLYVAFCVFQFFLCLGASVTPDHLPAQEIHLQQLKIHRSCASEQI